MNDHDRPVDKLVAALTERAKELNCLYEVERALNRLGRSPEEAFQLVVDAIPPGWQYPEVCRAMISFGDLVVRGDDFRLTPWLQAADIMVQDEPVGQVMVCYIEARPEEDSGPFLHEEERLIGTIADRLGQFLLYQQLHHARQQLAEADERAENQLQERWRSAIELLRRSDRDLYLRVARKLVNHLCWTGVEEAHALRDAVFGELDESEVTGEVNVPGRRRQVDHTTLMADDPFELAARRLGDDQLLSLVQAWIVEDRIGFLPKLLSNPRSTLTEVVESLRRYHHLVGDGSELSPAVVDGLRVSLIRRFLTDQVEVISTAKEIIGTEDFVDLLDHVIAPQEGRGRVGGKSAGLFLAERILRRHDSVDTPIGPFKIPQSWYLVSEDAMRFIQSNDLEEVLQQKYRDIGEVRHEYPNIVQLFKSSRFPPDIVRGLSLLLDEVGTTPLIVRSSSLLEDRLGSAFAGKYKSLFLGNQGEKQDRLAALLDAVAEVYASVFGPDPVAYRRSRGLIDFHEEMGVLIQEVVGTRVGDYYLPAAAGVAFSNNEFRWSPRIRRRDGLIRMVPGLGTRAVDRLSEDYPILAVPKQPDLRANTTIEEQIRYSPRRIDVLNLRINTFETMEISTLVEEVGTAFPSFSDVFSVVKDEVLHRPTIPMVNIESDELVADLAGFVGSSSLTSRLGTMLTVLEETLGTPVDIEFAYDGHDLYLLQCRPQSFAAEDAPAPIPKDVAPDDLVFYGNRHVSNGHVPDLSHIVYVDPEGYARLDERSQLIAVGQAVGQLNKLLPKRQFILVGPGRWGSRGDIRLGVSVTYADINNCAVLVEVARQHGNYVPDLSFGTHFFQDLVESRIRYLPLYPDEEKSELNESFLMRAPNLLTEMLPELDWLADVVRVIDVPMASRGRILRVLMNSDLDEAIGLLAHPDSDRDLPQPELTQESRGQSEAHWRWRMHMIERVAQEMDAERFGVVALYLIGSTKNATAGPGSDIDLVVHVRGSDEQRRHLEAWFDGWSLSLGEMNYLRTGYTTGGLLDVHYIDDDDIERSSSYAAKIDAVTDPALELSMGKQSRIEE